MNDFDSWNEIKKKISDKNSQPDCFPKEGEVWMSEVGKNVGFEQDGSGDKFSRPILIVKKFNNHMFWSIPLSTKQKNLDFYYNYTDPSNKDVAVVLAQMKLVSVKRIERKMYDFSREHFSNIKLHLRRFLT